MKKVLFVVLGLLVALGGFVFYDYTNQTSMADLTEGTYKVTGGWGVNEITIKDNKIENPNNATEYQLSTQYRFPMSNSVTLTEGSKQLVYEVTRTKNGYVLKNVDHEKSLITLTEK